MSLRARSRHLHLECSDLSIPGLKIAWDWYDRAGFEKVYTNTILGKYARAWDDFLPRKNTYLVEKEDKRCSTTRMEITENNFTEVTLESYSTPSVKQQSNRYYH